MPTVKVLSYGGGVQTTALLRMCLDGLFDLPDRVVFADTQDEPEAVYASVEREKFLCESRGIPFDIVTRGRLGDALAGGMVMVPVFTLDAKGKKGQLLRTCTDRYKIRPIRQHLRSLGVKKAELWLGMSTDEVQRVKPSPLQWISHRWPLIELDRSRSQCESYLAALGVVPVKSACVYCPYRSREGWQVTKNSEADYKRAQEYDETLRHVRPGFECFVHRNRKPLAEAIEEQTPSLLDDECTGFCHT